MVSYSQRLSMEGAHKLALRKELWYYSPDDLVWKTRIIFHCGRNDDAPDRLVTPRIIIKKHWIFQLIHPAEVAILHSC